MPEAIVKVAPPNLDKLRRQLGRLLELFDESVREQEGTQCLSEEQMEALAPFINKAVAKREKIVELIIALETEEAAIRKAVQSAEKMARRHKAISKGLRGSIALYMADNGIKRADTMTHMVLCKANAKVMVITDKELIPGDYRKEIPATWEPDKDRIRAALEVGKEIPGAKLEENGYSLTID